MHCVQVHGALGHQMADVPIGGSFTGWLFVLVILKVCCYLWVTDLWRAYVLLMTFVLTHAPKLFRSISWTSSWIISSHKSHVSKIIQCICATDRLSKVDDSPPTYIEMFLSVAWLFDSFVLFEPNWTCLPMLCCCKIAVYVLFIAVQTAECFQPAVQKKWCVYFIDSSVYFSLYPFPRVHHWSALWLCWNNCRHCTHM